MKNTIIKILDTGVLVLLAMSFVAPAFLAIVHEKLMSWLEK